MELKLEGKRALVTGSSSGIGAAVARMLASEGVAVVIHGRSAERAESTAQEVRKAGGTAVVALGDLATDEGATDVANAALQELGGIDILVNNVGGAITTDLPNWFAIPIDHWEKTFGSNTVSAIRLIHALVPGMRERGWGRIIQISSRNAQYPRTTLAAYAAAKAALNNMSISLSKALAHTGVTVNTLSCGLIQTPMFDAFLRSVAADRGLGEDLEVAREYVLKNMIKQTVSKMGQGEDIARVVAFLASPDSWYISGADFAVDGGVMPAG